MLRKEPTFCPWVSLGYQMDLLAYADLRGHFSDGRDYGMNVTQSWVIVLQFTSFWFLFKPLLSAR